MHHPRTTFLKAACGQLPAGRRKLIASAVAMLTVSAANTSAFEFDTGNPDLSIRWDNTLKYTLTVRAENIEKDVVADPEAAPLPQLADDADLGWEKGDLVNNRFDVLSEMDIIWKGNYGLRLSGAGWFDQAYRNHNDHPGYNPYLKVATAPEYYTDTWGGLSVAPGEYTDKARDIHYKDIELLDAFVFANLQLTDTVGASVRAGRHSIYWGNSLLLAGAVHGIAGSMSTIDAGKGFSVPGTEAKELFRPTNKLSSTLQLNPNLSLVGYYSFEFEEYRLPQFGTSQSRAEGLTPDDEFATLQPGLVDPETLESVQPRAGFSKIKDKTPDEGEWGVGVNYYLEESGWDLGLYYLNYHDKLPQGLNGAMNLGKFANLRADADGPAFQALVAQWPSFNGGVPADVYDVFTGGGYPALGYGNFNWVYKEDVQLVGFSAANELWGVSWGSDFVYRWDAPLNTWLAGQLQHVGNIPDFPDNINALVQPALEANGFIYDNWDINAADPGNYPGAVGESWHVVLNGVKFLNPSTFWDGGAYSFELTFSRVEDVTENEYLLHPRLRDKEVLGTAAFNFNPQWFQVRPGLDIRTPINISYTYMGEISPIAFGGTKNFGAGAVGIQLDYQQKWQAVLRYNFNFGPREEGIPGNTVDRGNVNLTVKRTF